MHWQLGQKIRTALNCLLSQAPTLPEQVMSMPSIMTRRTEVKNVPTDSRKRKRQEAQKRELPTRHSLLTDVAVADLEDAQAKSSKPQFTGDTVLCVSSDPKILNRCTVQRDAAASPAETPGAQMRSELQTEIKVPSYRMIEHKIPPAATSRRGTKKDVVNEDTDDEAYLRRHRKHEMAEKRVKNREKELLRYGMHQQMRLVERLKSMDRTNLLATLSPRLRRDGIGELDEAEVKSLHKRMIREAEELLMRYEALGLLSGKQKIEYTTIATTKSDTHRMPDAPSLPSPPPLPVQEIIAPVTTTSTAKPRPPSRKRMKLADKNDNKTPAVAEKLPRSEPKKKLLRLAPKPPALLPKPIVTKGPKKQYSFAKSTPIISRQEFSLPIDEFGEMMSLRG